LLPFVPTSVDLKGGTVLTLPTTTNASEKEISSYLEKEFALRDVSVVKKTSLSGSTIEIQYITPQSLTNLKNKVNEIKATGNTDSTKARAQALALLKEYNYGTTELETKEYELIKEELNYFYNEKKNEETNKVLSGINTKFGISIENTNIREVGATLGAAAYKSAINVSIWAIILVIIVIFLFFREFVPSAAVMLAGAMDILGGLAGMAIFNVPISLVTIPALLMLLGYSIDTDVMLTTKLMKMKEGSLRQRAGEAMKTGIMMTSTAIGAIGIMFIISWLYNIQVMYYISVVLIVGSLVDLVATWMMNAPVLLWYLEKKKGADYK